MNINVIVTALLALVIVVFIFARQIIQLPVTQRSLLMPLILSVALGGMFLVGHPAPEGIAAAKSHSWEMRYVEGRRRFHGCCSATRCSWSVFFWYGHAQPMSAIRHSTALTGTAQGVKMAPTKPTVAASARASGQIDGPGNSVRWSGSASSILVTSTSRRSLRKPVTTGASAVRTHNASRPCTTGIWRKL